MRPKIYFSMDRELFEALAPGSIFKGREEIQWTLLIHLLNWVDTRKLRCGRRAAEAIAKAVADWNMPDIAAVKALQKKPYVYKPKHRK